MHGLLATVAGSGAARGATVEVAGAPLHYLEAGRGPVVVLLHGGSGGGANWFRLIGPLAARYRVLAPDLPGFGLSPARTASAPLGVQAAGVLQAWLDTIGVERATVVGTSFGGLAGLRLAQRDPARVARLALITPVGLGPEASWLLRSAALPVVGPLVLRPSRRGTAWLFRTLLTSDRRTLSGAQQQALIEYLWRSAAAADPRMLARTVRLFAGVRGQREWLEDGELRGLPQPLAVIWGGRDRLIPLAHAVRLKRVRPDALFRALPRTGHSPNWEAPGAVLDALGQLLERPAP